MKVTYSYVKKMILEVAKIEGFDIDSDEKYNEIQDKFEEQKTIG